MALTFTSGFNPGNMVRVTGSTPRNASRFDVNFIPTDQNDRILHVSVRFQPEGATLVLNSKHNLRWFCEVRYPTTSISPGESFEIAVACLQHEFLIALNGLYFTSFPMRRSFREIRKVEVTGNVTPIINLENSRTPPAGRPFPFIQ